jgi:hypothetical protein
MNKTNFDNFLETLLEMDTDMPREMLDKTISIDQRVDLLLRAMFGSDRVFTPDDRAAARARVLDAMAADLERRIEAKAAARRNEGSQIRTVVASSPGGHRARVASSGLPSHAAARTGAPRTPPAVVTVGFHDELKGTGGAGAKGASGEWSKTCEINGRQYVATLGKSREVVLQGDYFDPRWKSLRLVDRDYTLYDDGLTGTRRCKGLGVGGLEKALKNGIKLEFVT